MAHGLLTGQTALVTGAGQGLGRAIAREYAAEGAVVALFERNTETLAQVHAEIPGSLSFAVDLTDHAAVAEAVTALIACTDTIDVLVNNAGIFTSGTIFQDSLVDWRRVLAVNLEAVYVLSKLVVRHMVAQHSGRIIHIASIAGMASRGNVGSYNASKGGVIALTKSMAVELAPYNITVNSIAPGFLRTAQMQSDDGLDLTTTDEFVNRYVKERRLPMARAGEPEDVAGTAVFLASDYCRYMTGQVVIVDGGLMSTF